MSINLKIRKLTKSGKDSHLMISFEIIKVFIFIKTDFK